MIRRRKESGLMDGLRILRAMCRSRRKNGPDPWGVRAYSVTLQRGRAGLGGVAASLVCTTSETPQLVPEPFQSNPKGPALNSKGTS